MVAQPHLYEVLIRESHLDTFGHVNNARYLDLFEEARWQMISERGYGLHDVIATQKGPIILEVSLKFKKELRLREPIRIETSTLGYRKKVGKIRQVMVNGAGDLCAEAEFTFAFFDLVGRKILPPSPEWLKAVGLQPSDVAG